MEPTGPRFTCLTNESIALDRIAERCLQPVIFLSRVCLGDKSIKVYKIDSAGTVKNDLPLFTPTSMVHTFCLCILSTIALIPGTLVGGFLKGLTWCTKQHKEDCKKLDEFLRTNPTIFPTSSGETASKNPDLPKALSDPISSITAEQTYNIINMKPSSCFVFEPTATPVSPAAPPQPIVFTKELYKTPEKTVFAAPAPLEFGVLNKLLDCYTGIDSHTVAQGKMNARTSILQIYQNGLAFRLGKDTPANHAVIAQMRYIISKIQEAPLQKKETLLQKLATCLEDCVPVTQGRLNGYCMELSGMGGFPSAFSAFLYTLKEQTVDETIYELYPEMQKHDYAEKNHYDPAKQHPHTKNAYLKSVGKEIGFEPPGASSDLNATRDLNPTDLQRFTKTFQQKLEKKLVKEFVMAINLQQDILPNTLFLIWAGKNGLGEEVFYEKNSSTYPSYTTPNDNARVMTAAYINEATAVKALRALGFIE